MTGIIYLSLVPLRKEPSERSEMSTQLLFGEMVEILETTDKWRHIRNKRDKYEGWADKKMITLLTEKEENLLLKADFKCVQLPLTRCCNVSDTTVLPGGSYMPYVDGEPFPFREKILDMNHADLIGEEATGERILSLACQYLYAPYLWGGKTILGIDCSGLVQVVFSMCGIQLPRDASQQEKTGMTIHALTEAKEGDLAFFENEEGKVTHVGILLNPSQIIHASGWVKIDRIDSQGIISSETGEYTHRLRIIKRIID